MKKNVYSLVLSEDVVAAIDRAAYQKGTNRSALINHILAEYVGYTTAEMRVKQIFASVQEILDLASFRLTEPSDTMLTFSSSLAYKYNPTMRYRVELVGKQEKIGIFRAMIRTQNPVLLGCMSDFCRVFNDIEMCYIGTVPSKIEPGRFTRELYLADSEEINGVDSTQKTGRKIAAFINLFDQALKTYFHYSDHPSIAYEAVESLYRDYLSAVRQMI